MCYHNGVKLKRVEYEYLMEMQKQIAFFSEDLSIHKGFDYGFYPVIRPTGNGDETERVMMQWGFLPPYLKNEEDVKRFRNGYKDQQGKWHNGYTTLNATSEELMKGFWRDAALHRRCLIPSNHYFEWMHVQVVGKSGKLLKTPEKFPYMIEVKGQPEFEMAGIWQPWTNQETGDTINTFAIITTEANSLAAQIHNSKKRMPTIPPGDLKKLWLSPGLSPQAILDVANFQIASAELKATPLHKDFLKRANPLEPVVYPEVPQLVY